MFDKKYQVIYVDPPWSYNFKSPTASPRPPTSQEAGGVEYYYNTMTMEDIMNFPIDDFKDKDCALFLWAVTPQLPEAFGVMKAWGFKYKTTITWHKLRCKGMGYWFRGHTEHLLVGVCGKIIAFRSLQHNIVESKVLKHSEKPPIFRQIIEDATKGLHNKIELFARIKTEGWDVWGLEAPKTIQRTLRNHALLPPQRDSKPEAENLQGGVQRGIEENSKDKVE